MNSLPAWITIKESPTYPKWKAFYVEYVPPESGCNNGSTNVYIRTETKDGQYQSGIKVWQQWPTDRASETTRPQIDAIDYCGVKYGASFFQSGDSSFNPDRGEVGPYSFYCEGNSDIVQGIGLVLKRHSQDKIVFRWVDNPTPPPPTQGHWELVDPSNRDNPQLKWVLQ